MNDESADLDLDFELDESGAFQVESPELKEWNLQPFYEIKDVATDYEDLNELNRDIHAAQLALFRVTETINKHSRLARASKIAYERNWRRHYLQSTEKTDKMRGIKADILSENLENAYIYHEQLTAELVRASYTLKSNLERLMQTSNNYRQQLKSMGE